MQKRPNIRVRFPDQPICSGPYTGLVARIINDLNKPLVIPTRPVPKVYVPKEIQLPLVKSQPRTIVPVQVRLEVHGSKVKLKLDCLTYDMYQKYFSKGKKPPLMEYIRSLIKAGYSEDKLNKVADSYKKWNDPVYLDGIQADIERIWPGPKVKRAQPQRKILKAVKKLS